VLEDIKDGGLVFSATQALVKEKEGSALLLWHRRWTGLIMMIKLLTSTTCIAKHWIATQTPRSLRISSGLEHAAQNNSNTWRY
jgi:hypothetical protein